MAYDSNWLKKARAKEFARQERQLTHIQEGNTHTSICGKGFFAGMLAVQYPSVTNLPGCRQCREKFLQQLGVEFDSNGYPLITTI
jgi:hypothetical protein